MQELSRLYSGRKSAILSTEVDRRLEPLAEMPGASLSFLLAAEYGVSFAALVESQRLAASNIPCLADDIWYISHHRCRNGECT